MTKQGAAESAADTICCFYDTLRKYSLIKTDEVTGVKITLPETCETLQYVAVAASICAQGFTVPYPDSEMCYHLFM